MLKAARKAEKAAKKDLKNARKALKAAKRLAKQSATKAKRGSPPIVIAATLANKGKGAAMKNTAQPDQSPISKTKPGKARVVVNPPQTPRPGPSLSAEIPPAAVVNPRIPNQPAPRSPAAKKTTAAAFKPAQLATAPQPLPVTVLKPTAPAATGALRPLSKATSALPPQSQAGQAGAKVASIV